MLSGESLVAAGNSQKAVETFQESRAIKEPIVAAHSRRIDYRRELARLYTDMGGAFTTLHHPDDAGMWYEKAIALWNELQDQHSLWAKELDKPKEVAAALSRVRSISAK
jgi:hypothetical protein